MGRLERMSAADECDLVKFCCDEKFTKLLESDELKEDWIHLMIGCIGKALRVDDTMKNFRLKLKDELLYNHQKFLTVSIL